MNKQNWKYVLGVIEGLLAATVPDNSVTNARLANVPQNTIKGRLSAGTGDPEDITIADFKALLKEYFDTIYSAGESGSGIRYFIARDEKDHSTSGGTFGDDVWQTRDLNTIIVNNIPGASLASNIITLPAGTYVGRASAPAYAVFNHQARLRDVTNNVTIEYGSNEYSSPHGDAQTTSNIHFYFTIGSETDFELQHMGESSQTTNGFGVTDPSNAEKSIYSQIYIEKI